MLVAPQTVQLVSAIATDSDGVSLVLAATTSDI
jgi:hypothetical protein